MGSSSSNHAGDGSGGGMSSGHDNGGSTPGGRGTASLRHISSGTTDGNAGGTGRNGGVGEATLLASSRRLMNVSGAGSGTGTTSRPSSQQLPPSETTTQVAWARRSGEQLSQHGHFEDSAYHQGGHQRGVASGGNGHGSHGLGTRGGGGGGSPGPRRSSSSLPLSSHPPPRIAGRARSAGCTHGQTSSLGDVGGSGASLGHQPSYRVSAADSSPGHSSLVVNSGSGFASSGLASSSPSVGAVVSAATAPSVHCLNPASEINSRLDTQVEVRVYPCNNNASAAGQNPKKKFTQFTVKPEGVIIQGTNRHRSAANDLGAEYALHVGRKLQRYELSDTRACQLLVTTHNKSFWVVPAPEAFSRHSGTCRLLGDRKHPLAPHTLQVGDFLRVGSVGIVVIETHNGVENRVLSEEKIQKIMKDTTSSSGGFLDMGETDGENSDDSSREGEQRFTADHGDAPVCYMCFDEEDTEENPLITPCKCLGDTRYVHVNCLRKWHTAEADNQICFLSSVDATCSVCKSTFKSDFKLKDGRTMKLFKSSLEPPYVSLLVATKHEMAQRLFNTRFQLSFSTILKPDGRNATRPLLLGRSSGSDMVLDYRTVSARHASIRFKNGEFIFTDAGSSNGSYLYLRRPVELTASQPVQFRLGRSMISMKVVNKWNRRLLRAVRRTGGSSVSSGTDGISGGGDDHSVGSNDDDVRISDGQGGTSRIVPRRTRESIMRSLPPPGTLSQGSTQHLDLLYALAYPKREKDQPSSAGVGSRKKSADGITPARMTLRFPSADTPGGSIRGGAISESVVASSLSATAVPSGSATPRVSAPVLESPASDEESKEELEEPEAEPAAAPNDDTIALVEGCSDDDGVDDEISIFGDEDTGGVINSAASVDEDATAILMMAPTTISEGSGGR